MVFPDYSAVVDEKNLTKFEKLWDAKLDPEPGLTVVEIVHAIHDGAINGMYILGENPAMSDPDVNHARAALAKLDHLVVQDIFLTETAMFADVILPASAWPEKNGTVSNTNRQVQMGRKALEAPGEAREDWVITCDLANRLGLGWTYDSPADVFAEMKLAMPSLDNITWDRLITEDVVAYPCPAPDHPGEDIVFSDRFPTASGLGKMVPAKVLPPDETPDADYPFILSTGRQLEHWHTGAMTRRSFVLDAVNPEPVVQMNVADITKLGVKAGDRVRVTTRRGEVEIMVRQDDQVPVGAIFIPFAFVEAAANLLTNAALDPYGKIPEFKFCAAKVEPAGSEHKVAAE
jgi:formate dehydrogenase major subunit